MKVFVDTSALYALLDEDDIHHREAASTFATLVEHAELLTHNYIHVEAEQLVRRRLGPVAATILVDDLLPGLTTIWIDEATHRAAIEGHRDAAGTVSLVDRVSFVVMRAIGIEHAFAFDRDFVAQGFVLPATPGRPPRRLSEAAGIYAADPTRSELVSISEIGARSGRSVNTIQSWRRRHRDFPEPLVTLAAGPVWTWSDIEHWIAHRS